MNSIQLTTEDKTDEIIVKIAETVAIFLEASPPTQKPVETLVDLEFDPSNTVEVAKTRGILRSLSNSDLTDFSVTPEPMAPFSTTPADCTVGICYRVPLTYEVKFAFSDGRTFARSISLPNAGPIVALSLDRAAFVEKVHDISFTNGTPSEILLKKPSEALEAVSIPLEIAKAILRVPAELIQLKIDVSDAEKRLAETEKGRIEAEAALKEAILNKGKAPTLEASPAEASLVFMFGANGPWADAVIPYSGELPAGPGVGGRSAPGNSGTGTGGSQGSGGSTSGNSGAGTGGSQSSGGSTSGNSGAGTGGSQGSGGSTSGNSGAGTGGSQGSGGSTSGNSGKR